MCCFISQSSIVIAYVVYYIIITYIRLSAYVQEIYNLSIAYYIQNYLYI